MEGIGLILLIVFGVILVIWLIVVNIFTFVNCFEMGPASVFSRNRDCNVLFYLFMLVTGIGGIIVGTLFGIITFKFLNW